MTTDTTPLPAAPAAAATEPRPASGYAGRWARVPRELGFLLPTLPIVVVSLAVLTALFSTGVGSIIVIFGIFILLAALFAARGFGLFELIRLQGAGFPPIRPPAWDRMARQRSGWAKALAPVIDGHYWLYLLHGMIVNPIVGIVTWTISFTWVVTGLGGVTYWFWSLFIPPGDLDGGLFSWVGKAFFPGRTLPLDERVGDGILLFVLGAILLATLPFVTRGLTAAHHGIARLMLGAFASEDLRERVTGLQASREAAVSAEDTALRRLERDIHDGPQQRLVRLQLDLATAERKLADDPEAARVLLAEARSQSAEALEELRALSRGFSPPLLLDRGLAVALESLCARNPIPTRLDARIGDEPLPAALERNIYFVVAEALTNAAKHSGATTVSVRVERHTGTVVVEVRDDGLGGARTVPGHGLAGLAERVRGLDGVLVLDSPAGGPTTVTVTVPVDGPADGVAAAR